jgi:hypothetical protein
MATLAQCSKIFKPVIIAVLINVRSVSTTMLPVTGCGFPFSALHHSHLLPARTNRINLLISDHLG